MREKNKKLPCVIESDHESDSWHKVSNEEIEGVDSFDEQNPMQVNDGNLQQNMRMINLE